MMTKSEGGESPAVSPEINASIRERLPRLCSAMAELALSRLEAHGLESRSCRHGLLRGVEFSARYYDPEMPHSDWHKSRQKESLESVRTYVEEDGEQIDEEDRNYLHNLEAYAALSNEQKIGGLAVAYFTMNTGDTRLGKWSLETIAAMREYREPDVHSGIGSAEIDADGAKLWPAYGETINLDVLLRTIDIFEKANEEDIEVNLQVTI